MRDCPIVWWLDCLNARSLDCSSVWSPLLALSTPDVRSEERNFYECCVLFWFATMRFDVVACAPDVIPACERPKRSPLFQSLSPFSLQFRDPKPRIGRPWGSILGPLSSILMSFGRPRAPRELRFQTWRTPRPPERRKKCTKRGFRGTMDACESFVRNTPCPEGCFCGTVMKTQ